MEEKLLLRFIRAVKHERFAFTNKNWFGYKVECSPLFCSYGKCGYCIDFYDLKGRWIEGFCYDWDFNTLYRDGEEDVNLFKAV